MLMWPSHSATLAWMPWVILLVELAGIAAGAKMILAALAAGLQVLSGGAGNHSVYVAILLPRLVECCREPNQGWTTARRFLAICFLAMALTAAQLFPFVDFALHCSRKSNFAGSEWSMPPWGWGNFLVPLFQTSRWQQITVQRDQYWTSSYYAGIGWSFLAAVALWRRRHCARLVARRRSFGQPRAGLGE